MFTTSISYHGKYEDLISISHIYFNSITNLRNLNSKCSRHMIAEATAFTELEESQRAELTFGQS